MHRLIPKSQYSRNVLMLIAGTSLAQAIPLAFSPILTRLYSPEEFGIFALFMSVVSILSVLVTGRYELAILLPRQDRDAIHIAALSIGLSFIISFLILLVIWLFNTNITWLIGAPEFAQWLYWVPASTLLVGIYNSLSYWSNRQAQYKRLAISRVAQSSGATIVQLASGFSKMGATGLVGGQLIGQAISSISINQSIYKQSRNLIFCLQMKRIFVLARKYIDFPKYMTLGHLANTSSSEMPILLISTFFGLNIAGFYSLAQRVLVAPMSLIGRALGDVFQSESAVHYRNGENFYKLFKQTILNLILLGIIIILPVALFGPLLFSIIFGESWHEAGDIASILAVMSFCQMISSPTGQIVFLVNLQKFEFIWQMSRLAFSLIAFFLGYLIFDSYKIAIGLHVVFFSFLYLFHLYYQFKVAKGYYK